MSLCQIVSVLRDVKAHALIFINADWSTLLHRPWLRNWKERFDN